MTCVVTPAAADSDEPAQQVQATEKSVLVHTTTLALHTLSANVTAYGRVQPDPDHLTSITLPRAGLVSRVWVRLGQRVSDGQPLLELVTAPATLVTTTL